MLIYGVIASIGAKLIKHYAVNITHNAIVYLHYPVASSILISAAGNKCSFICVGLRLGYRFALHCLFKYLIKGGVIKLTKGHKVKSVVGGTATVFGKIINSAYNGRLNIGKGFNVFTPNLCKRFNVRGKIGLINVYCLIGSKGGVNLGGKGLILCYLLMVN